MSLRNGPGRTPARGRVRPRPSVHSLGDGAQATATTTSPSTSTTRAPETTTSATSRDDEPTSGPRGPLPDPLDRVWLHPTELSVLGAAFAPPERPARAGPAPRPSVARRRCSPARRARCSPSPSSPSPGRSIARRARRPLDRGRRRDHRAGAPTRGRHARAGWARRSSRCVARDAAGHAPRLGRVRPPRRPGAHQHPRRRRRHDTVEVVTSDGQQHTRDASSAATGSPISCCSTSQDDADLPAAPARRRTRRRPGARSGSSARPHPAATSPWMSGGMASSNDALVVSDLGPTTSGLLETDAASNTAVGRRRARRRIGIGRRHRPRPRQRERDDVRGPDRRRGRRRTSARRDRRRRARHAGRRAASTRRPGR